MSEEVDKSLLDSTLESVPASGCWEVLSCFIGAVDRDALTLLFWTRLDCCLVNFGGAPAAFLPFFRDSSNLLANLLASSSFEEKRFKIESYTDIDNNQIRYTRPNQVYDA